MVGRSDGVVFGGRLLGTYERWSEYGKHGYLMIKNMN
jgi:hypothetical protein